MTHLIVVHLTIAHLVVIHLVMVHLAVIHRHIHVHLHVVMHLHFLLRRNVAGQFRICHPKDHRQVGEQNEENHEHDMILDLRRRILVLEDNPQFLQENQNGRNDAEDVSPNRNHVDRTAPLNGRNVRRDDIYRRNDEEYPENNTADVAQAVPFFAAMILLQQGKGTRCQNRFCQYHRHQHEENQKPR